jgi:ribosome assembly protein YihI (activator of Der GTPase)
MSIAGFPLFGSEIDHRKRKRKKHRRRRKGSSGSGHSGGSMVSNTTRGDQA